MSSVADVEITDGPVGVDSIVVDGEELADKVVAYSLNGGRGKLKELHLTVVPSTRIKTQAAVYVSETATTVDVMRSVAAWLRKINPSELEQMALANYGFGDSNEPFAKKILEILAQMAENAHE